MGRAVSIIAVLLALGAAAPALAVPAKCSLKKAAELPVTLAGGQALLPVKINGADTFLMVDSGAFYSIISTAAAVEMML